MKTSYLLNLAVITVFVACNSGCMLAARAVSQDMQPEPSRIFESADMNGDGIITREEFMASQAQLFSRIDRNGDGYIDGNDKSNRLAGRRKTQERLSKLMPRFDKDDDGRISQAEFAAGFAAVFERADLDHNGELSKAEVATAKQQLSQRAS